MISSLSPLRVRSTTLKAKSSKSITATQPVINLRPDITNTVKVKQIKLERKFVDENQVLQINVGVQADVRQFTPLSPALILLQQNYVSPGDSSLIEKNTQLRNQLMKLPFMRQNSASQPKIQHYRKIQLPDNSDLQQVHLYEPELQTIFKEDPSFHTKHEFSRDISMIDQQELMTPMPFVKTAVKRMVNKDKEVTTQQKTLSHIDTKKSAKRSHCQSNFILSKLQPIVTYPLLEQAREADVCRSPCRSGSQNESPRPIERLQIKRMKHKFQQRRKRQINLMGGIQPTLSQTQSCLALKNESKLKGLLSGLKADKRYLPNSQNQIGLVGQNLKSPKRIVYKSKTVVELAKNHIHAPTSPLDSNKEKQPVQQSDTLVCPPRTKQKHLRKISIGTGRMVFQCHSASSQKLTPKMIQEDAISPGPATFPLTQPPDKPEAVLKKSETVPDTVLEKFKSSDDKTSMFDFESEFSLQKRMSQGTANKPPLGAKPKLRTLISDV